MTQSKDSITIELTAEEAGLVALLLNEYVAYLNAMPVMEMDQVAQIDNQMNLLHGVLGKMIPEVDAKVLEEYPESVQKIVLERAAEGKPTIVVDMRTKGRTHD